MATVALICAMDKEIERIISDFRAVCISEKEKIYEAQVGENRVIATVCGIGKVNSAMNTQKIIERYSPDVVINCGVAGGLDKSLSVLDVVVVKEAQYHDFSPLSLLEEDPNIATSVFKCDEYLVRLAENVCFELKGQGKISNYTTGKVVSGDCFVESDELSRHLREDLNASCVEMEGASIAQVCIVNGVKFLIIRAISDFADNSAEMSYDTFSNIAAKQAVEVLSLLVSEIKQEKL